MKIEEIEKLKKRINPHDKFLYGIIPGFIVPSVCLYFNLRKFLFNDFFISQSFNRIIHSGLLPNNLLLSIIPNLFVVFVLYKLEAFKIASGVILGAMPFLITSVFMM
jgi:hypothetical protein